MNTPGIQVLGDEFLFTYPGPDEFGREPTPIIKILVARYRESSSGHHAELTLDSPQGRLLWTNLRLDSDRERVVLAKKLSAKWQDFDWDDALRTVCQMTVEAHREGDPIIDLATIEHIPAAAHLVEPLLPHSQVTILFGSGDSGKSILALWVASAVAYGLPLPSLDIAESGPALYLDWETDWKAHARRFDGLMKGFGITPTPGGVLYRRMTRPVAEDLRALKRVVASEGIKLVVADSLGSATGAELLEAGAATRCMNALRDLDTTVLAIHHLSKASRANGRASPFGSVYYENLARCTWEARRSDDGYGSTLALMQRKYNDGPKRKEPLAFAINYEQGITVAATSIKQEKSLRQFERLPDQIAHLLEDLGEATVGQLGEVVEASQAAIIKALNRDDRFVKLAGGQGKKGGSAWQLLTNLRQQTLDTP